MSRRKLPTATPLPKALACGILEDTGRVLFLSRLFVSGEFVFELPSVLVYSGRSPVAEIRAEFSRQTGIDGEIHEISLEGRFNAGSRKRKVWVPALGFKVTSKNRAAHPSSEFAGFKWLSLDEVRNKKLKLGRNSEWLRRLG